ncbi:cystathione beta-lyase [Amphibacillus marinus]|uniref:cysteine-S-conjugate beta-lyase n=1 Tax=Amphibacillus marinus TaxID=872970 RepID=A0A1H8M6B5_9BACI|nr:PatB family C-S lyase [Amphibacillus marinus]SEO12894.1 cystathione beta-lyase [Amphibacillus marinus]
MKFDFDRLVNRENIGNMKYISHPKLIEQKGIISYAGAEMDFKTAPVIIDAITDRAQNGLLGFTLADRHYLDQLRWWMATQRHWAVARDWIIPTYGTIFSIATAIRAFTQPGDGIIVQPPIYHRYQQAIARLNRTICSNPLIYQDGKYEIDFNHLEQCMAEPKNKIFILCNPHNPVGRIYEQNELEQIAQLSKKYQTLVISDEIFAEINFTDRHTIPYSSVLNADHFGIVMTSLGKTFNLTGVNHANVIIPNLTIRERFKEQRNADHFGSIDPMTHAAVCAAYSPEGAEWLAEMLSYVKQNINFIQDYLYKYLPFAKVIDTQGTYVVWIDFSKLEWSQETLESFLINEAYLDLDSGLNYGVEGSGFMRMNVACPRAELEKSMHLLYQAALRRGLVSIKKKS